MKEEKIKNTLKLEIYTKGGSQWYCDYYFYNGLGYEKGTTKAGGYGYDKHSTATSEAINKFKFLYIYLRKMLSVQTLYSCSIDMVFYQETPLSCFVLSAMAVFHPYQESKAFCHVPVPWIHSQQ